MKIVKPRQVIYPSNLSKILLGSIYPKELNEDEFSDFLKNELKIDKEFCLLSTNKARVGIYLIIKYLIKKKNKKKFLISPLTVFDVINMVILAGGEPIFIDYLNLENFNCNTKQLNQHNDINGIIICNYQLNSNITEIAEWASERKVDIIQDCAISICSQINNKSIANYSDYSVFSFNLFKFINSIHGGAIVFKDQKFKLFVSEETKNWSLYNFKDLIPYYLKGIQAKILTNIFIFNFFTFNLFKFGDLFKINFIKKLSKNDPYPHLKTKLPNNYQKKMNFSQQKEIMNQVKQMNKLMSFRKKNFALLNKLITNEKLTKLQNLSDENNSSYINFPLIIKYKEKEKFSEYLYKNRVDHAKYFYRDCSSLSCFSKYNINCFNSRNISDDIIIIPIHHKLGEKEIEQISNIINKY